MRTAPLTRILVGIVATVVLLVAGQLATLSAGHTQSITPAAPAPDSTPAATIGAITGPATPGPTATAAPVVPRTTPPAPATSVAVGFPPAPALGAGLPSWRVTVDGVPFYAGRPACSLEQAAQIAAGFAAVGASTSTQHWAVYVASRESGCDYTALNVNRSTRDRSVCMHQLNAHPGGPLAPGGVLTEAGWTIETATASFVSCVAAAADLWSVCGRGPWTHGDYTCRRPQE